MPHTHRKAGTLAGAPAGGPSGPREATAQGAPAEDSRQRASKGKRCQRPGGTRGPAPFRLHDSEGHRALT